MVNNLELSSLLESKYSLIKDANYSTLYKKFNRRFPKEKSNELLNSINNPYINTFDSIMKENNKSKYLENFYSNLSNSFIIKNKLLQKISLSKGVNGECFFKRQNYYLILGDKDSLEKRNAELTPYHELLHLLTTRFDNKKTIRIGFQINNFATGINEGYTELLTKRYFKKFSKNDNEVYSHFTWILNMIEDIVGKSKMEDYYFDINVEGLILELEKYISREKVINLIEDVDLLFCSEEKLFDYQQKIIHKHNKNVEKELDEYYDVNSLLRSRIYDTLVEINNNKMKQLGINNNFEEKNIIIKNKYDEEEELYLDFFKEKSRQKLKKNRGN